MVVRKKKSAQPGSPAELIAGVIAPAAQAQTRACIKLRRALHRRPELAFKEKETAKLIADELRRIGCRVKTGVGRTGVVGTLTGASSKGRVVAVRSDMDALPIQEKTGLPFASKQPGVMHACGHDAHMAIVVAVAETMAALKDQWNGTLKLIFQPAEEVPPGGAIEMIGDGVLEKPDVEMIFGLHVDPWIPVGKIGLKDGPMMAQVDDFDMIITGKSGHGARPHLGCDAVYIASQVVGALQSVVSRTTDPLQPAVLSIGRISGGVARNVIADEVRLEGTVRTLETKESARIQNRIATVARGTAKALGGDAHVDYRRGYPVLVNDPVVNAEFRTAAEAAFGPKAVVDLERPMMGGEDFAHFLTRIPGAMMRLGAGNAKVGAIHSWHHPQFTIDEASLEVGCRIICGALLGKLGRTDSPADAKGTETKRTTRKPRKRS
jgi:amidohydrolase